LENVLLTHVAHAPLPGPAFAVPPAHRLQTNSAAFAATLYAPASHTQSVTTVLPSRACELRAGHPWHAVWFGAGLNELLARAAEQEVALHAHALLQLARARLVRPLELRARQRQALAVVERARRRELARVACAVEARQAHVVVDVRRRAVLVRALGQAVRRAVKVAPARAEGRDAAPLATHALVEHAGARRDEQREESRREQGLAWHQTQDNTD